MMYTGLSPRGSWPHILAQVSPSSIPLRHHRPVPSTRCACPPVLFYFLGWFPQPSPALYPASKPLPPWRTDRLPADAVTCTQLLPPSIARSPQTHWIPDRNTFLVPLPVAVSPRCASVEMVRPLCFRRVKPASGTNKCRPLVRQNLPDQPGRPERRRPRLRPALGLHCQQQQPVPRLLLP